MESLFQISFRIIGRGVNNDQSTMSYVSMNSFRQALQTNGKFFSNFELLSENRKIFERVERREY